MSEALGLRRLQELLLGTTSLSDEPVWLLGLWYGLTDHDSGGGARLSAELQAALLQDFASRFWLTYRRDFPAIGASGLTSDVGWGCTLRSGQMLLAEALCRAWLGRDARFAPLPACEQQQPQQQQQQQAPAAGGDGAAAAAAADASSARQQCELLRLFLDEPGAPFSLHSLCSAGAAAGVMPGQWLGPWVLCKALAAAAAAAGAAAEQQADAAHRPLGLGVHVACDPGGGAPTLQPDRLRDLISGQGARGSERPLLLLVPLTLGVGRINERYLPQLAAALGFPQSVGIVGGRPGASLFFVGVQGSSVLYLDPHEVQEAPVLPGSLPSFHCCAPRLMPLASIDPSLALGFLAASAADLDDLLARLQALGASAAGAPLLTVGVGGEAPSAHAPSPGAQPREQGSEPGSEGDWEML